MKKLLGSLLLLSFTLYAKSAYEWKVELSEKELYLHQATLLNMRCSFSKEGKNDDVEFSPPTDGVFEFKLLSESRHFDGEMQTISYKYLLFAKVPGEHRLVLKPQMLFTTQSAIDNVIIGRDNVNDLEVEKETAKIPAIAVNVQPTSTALTGRLSLKTQIDLKEVSAYEPVHLSIKVEGEGNLQELSVLDFDIEGVEVFLDEPEKDFELGESGYRGSWSQRFAFVGEKDFTIPSIEIAYFDLVTGGKKVLKTEAYGIKIKPDGIKRETLIDKVDLPSEKFDFRDYSVYLYSLLSFAAGFILAKLLRFPKPTPKMQKGDKIKRAKTQKELLEVLILCDKGLFKDEITSLEASVYRGDKTDLERIKKGALGRL